MGGYNEEEEELPRFKRNWIRAQESPVAEIMHIIERNIVKNFQDLCLNDAGDIVYIPQECLRNLSLKRTLMSEREE